MIATIIVSFGALLRDGEELFEIQNVLASSVVLTSTLHRNDHGPNGSILKQAPKIIKGNGIKAWLGVLTKKKKVKCFGEGKGKKAVTEASN